MLRLTVVALMLAPGAAYAQKFVSAIDPLDPVVATTTASADNPEVTDADLVAPPQIATGQTASIVINDDTDIAFSGLGRSAVLLTGEKDAMISRIIVDESGEAVLVLTGAGVTDETSSGAIIPAGTANIEVGECNPGTTWQDEDALCWNDFATGD